MEYGGPWWRRPSDGTGTSWLGRRGGPPLRGGVHAALAALGPGPHEVRRVEPLPWHLFDPPPVRASGSRQRSGGARQGRVPGGRERRRRAARDRGQQRPEGERPGRGELRKSRHRGAGDPGPQRRLAAKQAGQEFPLLGRGTGCGRGLGPSARCGPLPPAAGVVHPDRGEQRAETEAQIVRERAPARGKVGQGLERRPGRSALGGSKERGGLGGQGLARGIGLTSAARAGAAAGT